MITGLLANPLFVVGASTSLEDDQRETLTVRGKVVDADKKPLVGIKVDFHWPWVVESNQATARTDANGTFLIEFHAPKLSGAYGARLQASSNDSAQMGMTRLKGASIKEACDQEYEIEIVPVKVVTLKVTDSEQHPLKGAHCFVGCNFSADFFAESDEAGTATFRLPENEKIFSVAAWMDDKGFDYRKYVIPQDSQADANAKSPEFPASGAETLVLDGVTPLTVRVVDDKERPVPGISVVPESLGRRPGANGIHLPFKNDDLAVVTDADGTAVLRWLPVWQKSSFSVKATGEGYASLRMVYRPESGMGTLVMQIERLVPLRGRVTHADGSPVDSIKVIAVGGGHFIDPGRGMTTTDKDGNYELRVPPEQIYLVTVDDEKWGAGTQDGFAVKRGQPVEGKDFVLRPATKIHGQLIDETTKEPVANQTVAIFQNGKKIADLPGIELAHPKSDRRVPSYPMFPRWRKTDANGRFEFTVGSGTFEILVQDGNPDNKRQKFEITSETSREFTLTSRKQNNDELSGLVVSGDPPRPLPGAFVKGVPRSILFREWNAVTTAEGKFQVKIPSGPWVLHVLDSDQKMGAIVDRDPDQLNITIPLKPLGSVRGRVIEEETDSPFANKMIEYCIQVVNEDTTFSYRFGGKVATDSDGAFQIEGLVQDRKYSLMYPTNLDSSGDPQIWMKLHEFTLTSRGTTELGDVKLKPVPKPYVAPTLDERIATAFSVPKTPLQRFEKAKETTKLVDQRLVLLFADPDDPFVRELMKTRFEDKSYAAMSSDFLIVAIPTDSKRLLAAKELAASIQESLDTDHDKCLLVVFDNTGKKLRSVDGNALSSQGAFSKEKLLTSLKELVPEPLDGQKLLDDALAKARAENKRVIVQETATWCGPCHRLSRYIDANRIWEKDYVWVRMDHRWTRTREIMEKLRNGDEGGIPWIAILDADGKVLASSNPGKDTCPPNVDQTLWQLERMIKSTSQHLTRDEIVAWIKGLDELEK